jgi:(1->4)-alpha-D-glucan 1-alpha-D-glucosylmutase
MTERPDLDPELFRFLKELLLLRIDGSLEGELAMRFQQLTGPAMAKGVEDTAFYRYHRLVALNEVGGDPTRLGITLKQFHQACSEAQEKRPLALLASTTHDTKRSEDVRARLALLSEMPKRWADAVQKWTDCNQRYRRGGIPDPNTEYLLYQTLVGAWPIDVERITAYMKKAVREAKVHTSWTKPDEAYERGLRNFIRAVMEDQNFHIDLERFVTGLVTPGRINSLAQTLIRLTAPGIPDIYQGTELWDLSLVDPDNRRPVDFTLRRSLLEELPRCPPEEMLKRSEEGLPKLWVIRQVLHFRRLRSELFGRQGSYRPLYATGSRADHVVAFIRGEGAITVTPRFVVRLNDDWTDTVLELPPGHWRNSLTGELFAGGTVSMQDVLARFPMGFFVPEDSNQ